MASFSELLRLNLQDTGSDENVWGQVLNKQMQLLEAAVAGTAQIVLSANDYTLSTNDGSDDEARSAVLDLQGNPSENLNVIVPAVSKVFLVRNNTTGQYEVTVRTQLGTGVKVPRGEARWVYCDGTNVLFAAKAPDTALVAGMTPGNAVERNVNEVGTTQDYKDQSLLDWSALNNEFERSGGQGGRFTTGDVKFTIKQAETGWVRANDGSIGPSGSGSTARADDDCEALYKLLWNNISDQYAPVSGGRGATADDDWAAAKPIGLFKTVARAIAVAGTPADSNLSSHNLGETVGEEKHTMTVDELVEHTHYSYVYGSSFARKGNLEDYSMGANNDTNDSGSDHITSATGKGDPFNVLGPRTYLNLLVKL
ncbi:hypothetical protein [Salinisphaera hydrothermalis]|uniref:Uncharacterized protein n=1 Tax=Salinisphaera hydrothermalis (strain C41B8) TaxID=1304275 RepID=A0A084INM2_SALHC|nr:hypothetical protein [Salinisphaera hydrothermalis]KEZ78306.1 hypothetical protein C41B8_05373 [Salinisphaera hydrothermalis C41B8]